MHGGTVAQFAVHPGQMVVDDLIGHRVALDPGQTLMTGRSATFPVGEDDEFMHRRFLQFWADGATWMVTNYGTRITAGIHPRAENSFAELRVGPVRHCRCRRGSLRWSSRPPAAPMNCTSRSPGRCVRPPSTAFSTALSTSAR
ncbi:hypothetical protein [Corynebacterium variabile]|uniref:hypothetical protein n=1 Tax=Corynebacterium variabile TaxID=1727 RepID=UPI0028AD54F7|nr:hypothetical protein [Corynebacterium variabile]